MFTITWTQTHPSAQLPKWHQMVIMRTSIDATAPDTILTCPANVSI